VSSVRPGNIDSVFCQIDTTAILKAVGKSDRVENFKTHQNTLGDLQNRQASRPLFDRSCFALAVFASVLQSPLRVVFDRSSN
jgi:hypothetical protein